MSSGKQQTVESCTYGFPSCEFADWKNNMSPWHVFAIFEKIDDWDWNSFSVNYRNSPYFCLDIKKLILDSYIQWRISSMWKWQPRTSFQKWWSKAKCVATYFKTLPKMWYVKRSKASIFAQTNKFFDISCTRRRNFG